MINKKEFLATVLCPTFGWQLKHSPDSASPSPAEKLRIDQGLEIHERARGLFPEGIMISGSNEACAEKTEELLLESEVTVLFETTFIHGDFIAKADILIRDGSRWKLIEVKSNVDEDNENLLDDLSYTVFVAQEVGLPISTCSLFLVSRDYRLGMPDENLLLEIDHTNEAIARAAQFRQLSDGIAQTLSSAGKPARELRWECRDCDIFEECCGGDVQNHIFDLPRLSHTKFCQLADMGVVSIEDIPEDFNLTDSQLRVRQAVLTGEPIIDTDGLRDALNSILYPAYFLDFETTQTCIPLYEGISPYGQIPTQYSIHVCDESGVIGHREYLADPSQNCSRILAENLIRDLGIEGSIMVYTGFEQRIINGLIGSFPDLTDKLTALLGRLVDLCEVVRQMYYDPQFHGSFSIKKVLPVVVPDMGYEGMSVDNGTDAPAVFAYMAKGKYDASEMEEVRASLLEYCGVDTMAMVRVVAALQSI